MSICSVFGVDVWRQTLSLISSLREAEALCDLRSAVLSLDANTRALVALRKHQLVLALFSNNARAQAETLAFLPLLESTSVHLEQLSRRATGFVCANIRQLRLMPRCTNVR